jgi:hypothetical protein
MGQRYFFETIHNGPSYTPAGRRLWLMGQRYFFETIHNGYNHPQSSRRVVVDGAKILFLRKLPTQFPMKNVIYAHLFPNKNVVEVHLFPHKNVIFEEIMDICGAILR